jgi:hypothetical protein
VRSLTLVPYAQAEVFYDTRFGAWNRRLYQGGVEIELTKHLRVEPYYARQEDQRALPRRTSTASASCSSCTGELAPAASGGGPPPTTVHDNRHPVATVPHPRAFSSLRVAALWPASCPCEVRPDLTIGREEKSA